MSRDDRLIDSGAGADFLSGGPGNDRFVFGAAIENLAGTNVVTDFGASSGDDDIIELQGYGIAGFSTSRRPVRTSSISTPTRTWSCPASSRTS